MVTFIFDIDDTLYDQVTPFVEAYDDVFGQGNYDIDVIKLFVQSRKHSDEVYEQSLRGEMSMKDMQVYRIQKAFEDFNIFISEEDAWTFQKIYAKKQKEIKLPGTIAAMLNECAEKAQLGVVTNGPDKHQMAKAMALGLTRWIPEEYIVISGAVGVAKPEPEIFAIAVKKIQPDGEVYYIGDSFRNDILGAKGAGLKTVWMNRRNHEIPEGEEKPDYTSCVAISTTAALHEMLLPGVMAVVVPLIVGIVLGVESLGGLLSGALVTGVLMAIFMSNAGGAWDNAKKYIETGHHGGKGSEAHKAAVVGDTVGDPFKDTSGPSINILIKLMTIVSLVFAPLFLSIGGLL